MQAGIAHGFAADPADLTCLGPAKTRQAELRRTFQRTALRRHGMFAEAPCLISVVGLKGLRFS
jgi:hypothetical protein